MDKSKLSTKECKTENVKTESSRKNKIEYDQDIRRRRKYLFLFIDGTSKTQRTGKFNCYTRNVKFKSSTGSSATELYHHAPCVKSVEMRSFLLVCIFLYSVRTRENTDQKNAVFGHFSHSGYSLITRK